MLITGFATGALSANCWVVAVAAGAPCVLIDPGMDAEPRIDQALAEHDLRPAAVLLTHGHLDHSYDATAICARYDIPVHLHPADRGQLTDPWSALGLPRGMPVLDRTDFAEPARLVDLAPGPLAVAGLEFTVHESPGHTPGSVALELSTQDIPILFSGDFLFAGSIGRMDFPGGDETQMYESLERVLSPMTDDTVVHPGHGDSTTIGHERAANPYLRAISQQRTS
ncbi:MAG TPA: MBL fold metallo-hydrolase [Mycobacteriales bacterium]|nr:MBL fold metallo-hydrolase [Mycobacteriales bacterium]